MRRKGREEEEEDKENKKKKSWSINYKSQHEAMVTKTIWFVQQYTS